MPLIDREDRAVLPVAAIAGRVRFLLDAASLPPAYREALTLALALPDNILSAAPGGRWACLAWTCCLAAGGQEDHVVPVAAAVELFMVALDVLDDEEDGEETPIRTALSPACALNVSTGLLFLAQQGLLDAAGPSAVTILLTAGVTACGGQHADLAPTPEQGATLDASLVVTAEKSASLVAAICQLGALCGGAAADLHVRYAQFGRYLGMVVQLTNDLAAIQPGASGKTDIARGRPILPLVDAARHASHPTIGTRSDADTAMSLWTQGPAYLSWTVADTYRRYALAVIPQLTDDPAHRAALAQLVETR